PGAASAHPTPSSGSSRTRTRSNRPQRRRVELIRTSPSALSLRNTISIAHNLVEQVSVALDRDRSIRVHLRILAGTPAHQLEVVFTVPTTPNGNGQPQRVARRHDEAAL